MITTRALTHLSLYHLVNKEKELELFLKPPFLSSQTCGFFPKRHLSVNVYLEKNNKKGIIDFLVHLLPESILEKLHFIPFPLQNLPPLIGIFLGCRFHVHPFQLNKM